ncbi:non-ribosomal peptide synthetase [Paenibacillus arenilitoris]|uniref:Amino acid adenylation domain-containing protein n=1 Tax=Paenibacillus arenilitoris TaxID=2772299 RepID=A0A927CQV8_9BACL|nr:amino acid adenylation domain-containing protein [Paenibacillus arenilitoris]MBD2871902.1 amino acid adenylation domain-containing protein [Paenibacillus arenilitoris]
MLTTKCRCVTFRFSSELVEKLISFSHTERIELQAPLLTAWAGLFYRYTGLEQIVVGIGREGEQDKAVPLAVDFSEINGFRGQVKAVHAMLQTVLFDRDETTSVFTCSALPSLGGLQGKSTVTLEIAREGTKWTASLLYPEHDFEEAAIRRMSGHLLQLLAGYMNQPEVPMDRIPLLTGQEAAQLLLEWNSAGTKPAENPCIPHWFEAQVRRTPDAAAIVHDTDRLTYAELDQRANRVAHYLLQKGIGPETLIGVHMERSIDMAAAILGILKAGGAYVPMDPAYASERLSYILEDAKAPLLVTQESLAEAFAGRDIEVVCMDRDRDAIREAGSHPPRIPAPIQGDHLAYVIYTSGSTGIPKGVAVEHSSVIALMQWAQEVYTPEEMAGVLGSTSINFDLSVFEMFVTWSMGGTLILAENALQLPHLPAAGEVTLINTVPSAIRELVRMKAIPASVRTVNLAGEPLKRALVEQIYEIETVEKVINLYGPSEDTTYSTFSYVDRGPELPVFIGRPIPNTQAYVLDKHLLPVPVGVPGELYLGGAGLARGYWNQEELTKQKFISKVWRNQSNERLYRTGDLVRYAADGNLEYLGRMDHQIKIRGFRIELGDIESTCMKHPDVQEAVVVAKAFNSADDLRLVAYFTTKTEYSQLKRELKIYLQQKLPDYMIPSYFVPLEQIPLTANGKIDRGALPQLEMIQASQVAPRNETEEKLAAIWRDVLQLESLGIEDPFLAVGGQSILAAQILVRMRSEFQIDLTQRMVFEASTIAEQAQVITEARKQGIRTASNVIVPRDRVARHLQG